jgi:hypothetical protein
MQTPESKLALHENNELLEIMGGFTEEYNTPPLDSYISYFDLSTVGELDSNAPEEEKTKPCIVVKLREALPEGQTLPTTYKGVKVFVK